MTRIVAAILAGLGAVPASLGTAQAADLAPFQGPGPAPTPGHWPPGAGGRIAGTVAARVRPEYSYYGEYGYPAPFGYGYAYAPVPSRGFEYGYQGPRYVWTAPDSYSGPAFGYHEW